MDEEQIERCRAILAREEKLARSAPSEAAAELHKQKALLYRVELAVLEERRRLAMRMPPPQVFPGR